MAASLDSHFVIAPSLEMYFVNKDTGLPLVNGKIYFFADSGGRTIPKSVYQIVSAAPGGPYTYVALPNPVTLSAVGTFQDNNNNDILPYYFPYAGTPESPGAIELYYIEVYDSMGVLQFTREAWPNLSTSDVEADQDITNFVPNGQFLLHTNIPATPANSFVAGRISQATTEIGQGGWSFDRPNASTAVDSVTFTRYPTTEDPTGNPRYAVQIQTTTPGADSFKDLRLKFPSVNTFASTTQPYNLYFEAEALNGSDVNNCQIIVIKNYGSGGSATTEDVIATFSLSNGNIQKYNFSITFGVNTTKSIGLLDDDYMQIAMRLPGSSTLTALFTNFAITVNDELLSSFPIQTNAEQLAPSTAGWFPTPAHDGSDLYLPVRLSPTGLEYDHSEIGKIVASISLTPGIGELLCDGARYLTAGYSSDGIPYSRLQAKLFNTTINLPIYGTGVDFITMYQEAAAGNFLLLSTNPSLLAPTAPSSATVGFTISLVHTRVLSYGIFAYPYSATSFVAKGVTAGSVGSGNVTPPNADTSGFTISDSYQGVNRNRVVASIHYFEVTTVSAAALANPGGVGRYWSFTIASGPTTYYMWFQITNETDPAPGPNGIKINLHASNTAADVSLIVQCALNSGGQYLVETNAGSAITQNSYWTFGNGGDNYYVWYNKDSAGTDPAPGGFTFGIEVKILTADTNAQVATKTLTAINKTYFSAPSFQGLFLRGYDPIQYWDLNANVRLGTVASLYGNHLGTHEIDQIYNHQHNIVGQVQTFAGGGINVNELGGAGFNQNTAATGGSEDRPVNAYVNWMIKY